MLGTKFNFKGMGVNFLMIFFLMLFLDEIEGSFQEPIFLNQDPQPCISNRRRVREAEKNGIFLVARLLRGWGGGKSLATKKKSRFLKL